MGAHRSRVADIWDEALAEWTSSRPISNPLLQRWRRTYQGSGTSAVVDDHYPDPYTGDLRGSRCEPRIVTLGLNPGVGYDSLQGVSGTWTKRIRESSYSACLDRFPRGDAKSWISTHGKESPYWRNLVYFARRWLGDAHLDGLDILNFELFPWHSVTFSGRFLPESAIAQEMIFDPVSEVDTSVVFAFGAHWFATAKSVGLKTARAFTDAELEVDRPGHTGWRMSVFSLSSRQFLLVSSQPGSNSPPGPGRTELMRQLIADYTKGSVN